ncbi:MAG: leucine-rich repeat domain-containing protein [Thermogutta sp.]
MNLWIVAALIGSLLAGIGGLFWRQLRRADAQWRAVRVIQRHGGWVFYNCEYANDGSLRAVRPRGPAWARQLLGPDFFDTPNGVYLGPCSSVEGLPDFGIIDQGIPVTDDVLGAVGKLPELHWLVLCNTKITDRGLENLEGLKHLRWLWLNDTAITDQGLFSLARLVALEKIWLDNTCIRGPGLKAFQGLPRLRWLSLRNTSVDDSALELLRPLTQLEGLAPQGTRCSFAAVLKLLHDDQRRSFEEALIVGQYARSNADGQIVSLDLSRCRVRDDDLAELRHCPALEWLVLKGNPITDDGLSHLSGLTRLSLLDLSETKITDQGLHSLASLSRLTTLHLEGTNVTAEGIARLQQQLGPRLRIYFIPPS